MSMEKMSGLKSTLAVSALTLSGLFMQAHEAQAQCVPDKYESATVGGLIAEAKEKSHRGIGFVIATDKQEVVDAYKGAAERLCNTGIPIKFFFNVPAGALAENDHLYTFSHHGLLPSPVMNYANMNMKGGNLRRAVYGLEHETPIIYDAGVKKLPPEPTASSAPNGPG